LQETKPALIVRETGWMLLSLTPLGDLMLAQQAATVKDTDHGMFIVSFVLISHAANGDCQSR
jgi:hypothetical protein